MTERTLPTIGVGVLPRPVARPVTEPRTGTAVRPAVRPAVARNEAILSTPARAGMLFGASAAIYAVTLAGVSGLQAESDAAVAAGRAPYLDAIAESRAANDALESQVQKADAEVRALVATYGEVGTDVEAFQARLDSLAVLVADVQGRAAALPARIKLPSVTVRGASSGGGGGTTRSGSSSGSGRATAPATTTKTGASGG